MPGLGSVPWLVTWQVCDQLPLSTLNSKIKWSFLEKVSPYKALQFAHKETDASVEEERESLCLTTPTSAHASFAEYSSIASFL